MNKKKQEIIIEEEVELLIDQLADIFVEGFLLELKQEDVKNGGNPYTPPFFIIEGLKEIGKTKKKNKNLHQ